MSKNKKRLTNIKGCPHNGNRKINVQMEIPRDICITNLNVIY